MQVCKAWARLCETIFKDECHLKGWSLPRIPRGVTPSYPVSNLTIHTHLELERNILIEGSKCHWATIQDLFTLILMIT